MDTIALILLIIVMNYVFYMRIKNIKKYYNNLLEKEVKNTNFWKNNSLSVFRELENLKSDNKKNKRT
jgi:hypothetical protein